jgi:predicted nucleic acid-binding protein
VGAGLWIHLKTSWNDFTSRPSPYGWRPNLPDEGDNHLIELALAGGAHAIVTHNLRDLMGGQLRLGKLRVLTPAQCLEELK